MAGVFDKLKEVVPIPEPVLGPRGAGKPRKVQPVQRPKAKVVPIPKPQFFNNKSLPIGLRLNNPGNLEAGAPFVGRSKVKRHARFETFDSNEMGLRALTRVFRTYQKNRGLKTIEGMINRYAPPSDDNPTRGYIKRVAEGLGVNPKDPIETSDRKTMLNLLKAVIQFENGQQPFGNDMLNRAIDLEEDVSIR